MDLTPLEVKAIVKGVAACKKVRIFRANTFVEPPMTIKHLTRYCFFVSKGGHGRKKLIAEGAAGWVNNVVQSAAGAGTSGLGAVGSGVATISGKAEGLTGLASGFKKGAVADANTIEKKAGANNLMHLMAAQDHVAAFGVLDVVNSNWSAWFGLERSAYRQIYLRRLKDEQVIDENLYQYKGGLTGIKRGFITINKKKNDGTHQEFLPLKLS